MSTLSYPDTATFVEARSNGYAQSKVMYQQFECDVIFVQSTSFRHLNQQDQIDADAMCFPDPENSFIQALHNRLEGLYILMPLFGGADERSWYKVTSATVNRDHLLSNQIDNIELVLKKAEEIPGVS